MNKNTIRVVALDVFNSQVVDGVLLREREVSIRVQGGDDGREVVGERVVSSPNLPFGFA